MTFTPEQQVLLLDLQKLDQQATRLAHTRSKHPSHGIVQELSGRADDLRRAAVAQQAVVFDLEREATQIADDIEKVQARREKQEGRIVRNEVPLRDVSAMQHEIDQMTKRIGALETEQIDVEERLEAARSAMDAMRKEGEAILADVEAAKAKFAEDMGDVEEEMRAVATQREELVASFPAGLLAEYDYARDRNGALAIIEVRGGVVVSAGAELSPLEMDALRNAPVNELYWTEDTYQIVVRTS